jgi:radical SAM protein with 4Fe4S-binding SPASM domain
MTERTYIYMSHDPPWKGEGPPATHIDIELTERCNNACIHCCINKPAGDKRSQARELGTNAWKEILRQAADLGVMTVRFTGGEPLLRDDFSELYLFARRLGLKVLLFTNARLITPQIAAMLTEIPPLADIEISVYGMSRESYEAVTGVDGAYPDFLSGLQLLLDRKIPFVVKGTLLPPNKHEIDVFTDWALAIPWMKDTPPSYAMFFDLRMRRDSVAKNSKIRRLRVSPEEGLEFLTRHADRYRREMSEFFEKFLSPPGDHLFTCCVGPGCVDAYGIFHPCLSLRHPALIFDLKKGNLKEALADGFSRPKEMRVTNPIYLERCARCFLKGLCEQCPAKSWTEHGTLDTPVEYFCSVAHAQARFLGLVRDKERAWEIRDSRERIQNLKRSVTAS